ncbi:hypothetical protein TYRP_014854 [Tyrophagus putrescentiae]|nr:hypothetical protein TYRP_014854 [Tyrophagus putrescentiae]
MFFIKTLHYYCQYIDCWSSISVDGHRSATLVKRATISLLLVHRLNFIFGSLFSMAALLSRDLYFHHNRPMIAFLGGLLFKGNLDYYFIWWRQGNAIVTQPIKKLAVAVVNALQVFPLIERSLLFYGHLLMAIICYSSNSVAFTLAMKHFSLTLIQTATLGLTVTFAFFVSLNHASGTLQGAGTVEQYHFLRRYFIHTVATFLASNRLLSKLFATFLLFNLPINAYLVNLVFTRDLQ